MNNDNKIIISLDEIERIAQGQIIEIPSWEPNKTIYVKVRRLNITKELLSTGNLPNILSGALDEIFQDEEHREITGAEKEKIDKHIEEKVTKDMIQDTVTLEKFTTLQDMVCKKALIEPTYEEIEKRLSLTDEQKIAIFSYVIGDVDNLRPFRRKRSGDAGTGSNMQNVADTSFVLPD